MLRNKLQKAALRDRPGIYAEAGYWTDTLKTLADLRNANPSDRTLASDWADLLDSQGLGTIAQEPLVNCCVAE